MQLLIQMLSMFTNALCFSFSGILTLGINRRSGGVEFKLFNTVDLLLKGTSAMHIQELNMISVCTDGSSDFFFFHSLSLF